MPCRWGENATEVLKKVNQDAIRNAPYGNFMFGPVRDDKYVAALPQVMLGNHEGAPKPIEVMAIDRAGKEQTYAPSGLGTSKDLLRQALAEAQPHATPATINTWMDVYPDVLDGTYPWRHQTERYKHMT